MPDETVAETMQLAASGRTQAMARKEASRLRHLLIRWASPFFRSDWPHPGSPVCIETDTQIPLLALLIAFLSVHGDCLGGDLIWSWPDMQSLAAGQAMGGRSALHAISVQLR